MKLAELQKITDSRSTSIMAALLLGKVRTNASVNGVGAGRGRFAPNRASLRAAKYHKGENSAYGHIYAKSVDPAEVAKRRAKNKVARKSRASNRKQG